jgi:hypothetical protein
MGTTLEKTSPELSLADEKKNHRTPIPPRSREREQQGRQRLSHAPLLPKFATHLSVKIARHCRAAKILTDEA